MLVLTLGAGADIGREDVPAAVLTVRLESGLRLCSSRRRFRSLSRCLVVSASTAASVSTLRTDRSAAYEMKWMYFLEVSEEDCTFDEAGRAGWGCVVLTFESSEGLPCSCNKTESSNGIERG